jgi:mRNA interferase YafQ
MKKRGKDLAKLQTVVRNIAEGQVLDARHRDHALVGEWKPARDCHIGPTGFLYTQSTESPSGWSAQELTAISSRSENPNQPLHAIREGSVGKRKRRTDEV